MFCRSLVVIVTVAVSAWASHARAQVCRVVEVDFVPTEKLQIVAWLETVDGTYVDTIYITAATGRYGLGNRPGMMEFNSSPRWPYGARTGTFPIWSHRHGLTFPQVHFVNSDGDSANEDPLDGDRNLSHPVSQSSQESYYCRPLLPQEFDATCTASLIYTDKGKLSATRTSGYPPRADIGQTSSDDPTVSMFAEINPFDEISSATPIADQPTVASWPVPTNLPQGNYRLLVEVAKEGDHNETYSVAARPAPLSILWSDYGRPYRGQPSVLYEVPFTITGDNTVATVTDYAGYGHADGADGSVREPDETITTGINGTGAGRLSLAASVDGAYRVRVRAQDSDDRGAPGAIVDFAVTAFDAGAAELVFRSPGDDGYHGVVAAYDVRYSVRPLTEANFAEATPLDTAIPPTPAGIEQAFTLGRLLPLTTYYVGIRALDECGNQSPLALTTFTTSDRTSGSVDACFIATAAYGSLLADDVASLRHLRDAFLRKHGMGELATQMYYTFGPVVASAIDQSELLRASTREVLQPIVALTRSLWVPPWLRGLVRTPTH